MRKFVITIVGIVVAAIILSSCTVQQCATYSSTKYPHEGSTKCAYQKSY